VGHLVSQYDGPTVASIAIHRDTSKLIFLPDYDGRFGRAAQTQKLGLDFLLSQIEADDRVTMIREAAYMLGQFKGEAGNFQPIKEIHASRVKQPKLWRTQERYWPTGFYGRGYVQLTHEDNYRKAGQKLAGTNIVLTNRDNSERTITIDKETFVKEPNLVMQPTVAYLILSRGMHEGWFRKRKNGVPFKLSDFIKGRPTARLPRRTQHHQRSIE